ncbi:MAG: hypothetical protein UR52_C0016G0009 [Candidatus Gottesmanbacteria bacterium GW2011_GWA1_34_13]|uniref:Uncharacterized protein n=1 Tax=Candidatus Gottesmanbacteria bacterium GW2011_GWA1_34_13 TaxID=1618434 RepID=A0A0G0D699_9BACT|nr:MAG: hypothetical protein UR52_C0016G0009 [Candidatus Gottesmanbacteria bacterium GW2011_GWA1_34_13]
MPKKTKQQKILAAKHKQKISGSMVFSYTAPQNTVSYLRNDTTDFSLIRKDILKTMILAVILITIEIGLTIYSKKLGW